MCAQMNNPPLSPTIFLLDKYFASAVVVVVVAAAIPLFLFHLYQYGWMMLMPLRNLCRAHCSCKRKKKDIPEAAPDVESIYI